MSNKLFLFSGSILRLALIGAILLGGEHIAFASPPSGEPYYVIEDSGALEATFRKSDFSRELDGLTVGKSISYWTGWENCGVHPEGTRREHGDIPWWKVWRREPVRWAEFRIPATSIAQILECQQSIPLLTQATFRYRGKLWKLDATSDLNNGKLSLAAPPALIKEALDRVFFSTDTIEVSGQKLRIEGELPIQIWVYKDLVRLRGKISITIENRIPVKIAENTLDFPLKSLEWTAKLSQSINEDSSYGKVLARLGYKREPVTCDNGLCEIGLCDGAIQLVRVVRGNQGHLHYWANGKINRGALPDVCP